MADDDGITIVQIPFPGGGEAQLRISVGPAKLKMAPGDGSDWVSGTYRDPSHRVPCRVTTDGSRARISQESRWRGVMHQTPVFDLQLGKGQPYRLTIESGATDDSTCDLGGLPITSLDVRHGAGEFDLDFSAPNPGAMDRLHLVAGATELEATNLANANAAEIAVEGGAASFTLDFGGVLQRDARVKINAGVASVEVRVPAATAAKITPHAVLGSVDAGDGFTTREGGYWTAGAVAGGSPVLTIDASVALGSLKLRTTEPQLSGGAAIPSA
ncbi:MAG TPA: hypothetical protein VH482_29295 [Thermomicrobiales bacterium]|jgi:hypothetical protein